MRSRRWSLRRLLHEYRGRGATSCPISKTLEMTRSLVYVRPRAENLKIFAIQPMAQDALESTND